MVKALLAGDLAGAQQYGMEAIAGVLLELDAGRTTEEFTRDAAAWLAAAEAPALRRAVPGADLRADARADGRCCARTSFRVFIVTGGGVEFVRAVGEELYGVAPDDVVGSAVQVELRAPRRARRARAPGGDARLAQRGAAEGGQHPGATSAAGRSSPPATAPATREMLEYAHTGERPSLCLVVDHDDAEREYAYAGASVTEPGRRVDRRHRGAASAGRS